MVDAYAHLTCGALTDVGVKRKNNEDSITTLPDYGVFCVADGMGGAQGGEVASKATVTCLDHAFNQLASPENVAGVSGKARIIDRALNQASAWIKARADKKGVKGTGTTAVVIAFDGRDPSRAMVVHAGDSRAYRFRAGKLNQVSRDHTVANAAGVKNEADLPAMFRGVVTRAVGVNSVVELEQTPVDVCVGDLFLLCSDGLDKLMPDKDITSYLNEFGAGDLDDLARKMVDETNKRGGVDNVSVILIRVGEADPANLVSGTDADDKVAEPATAGIPFGDDEIETRDGDPTTRDSRPLGQDLDVPAYVGSSALETADGLEGVRPVADKPVVTPSDEERSESRKKALFVLIGIIIVGILVMLIWPKKSQKVLQFNEGVEEFTGTGEVIRVNGTPDPAADPNDIFAELTKSVDGTATPDREQVPPRLRPLPPPPGMM
jgi:serine/threonine protein phosphatase PrpC